MRALRVLVFRYLRSRRIAAVCVLAVAVGVLALIVLFALMDGVQTFLRSYFARTRADLLIAAAYPDLPEARRQQDLERLLAPYRGPNGPIAALSPRYPYGGLLAPGEEIVDETEDSVRGVELVGIDFPTEARVIPLRSMLDSVAEPLRASDQREDLLEPEPGGLPRILLGDTLAEELGLAPRPTAGRTDRVTIVTGRVLTRPDGTSEIDQRRFVFQVAGCFSSGHRDFDRTHVYLDRQMVRRLIAEDLATTPELKLMAVKLHEPRDLEATLARFETESPTLLVRSWERSPELRTLEDQKRVLFLILALVVVVACAAVFGLISMMVVEKTRDIGILMSMGMTRARVVLTFTTYGCLLTGLGAAIGLILAIWVTRRLDNIVNQLSRWFGVQLLNPEVYGFKSVPVQVDPHSMFQVVSGVLVAGFLASVIPASRVAFLTPVRCFRAE